MEAEARSGWSYPSSRAEFPTSFLQWCYRFHDTPAGAEGDHFRSLTFWALASGFLMLNAYMIILAWSLSFRLECQVIKDECGQRRESVDITSHSAVCSRQAQVGFHWPQVYTDSPALWAPGWVQAQIWVCPTHPGAASLHWGQGSYPPLPSSTASWNGPSLPLLPRSVGLILPQRFLTFTRGHEILCPCLCEELCESSAWSWICLSCYSDLWNRELCS